LPDEILPPVPLFVTS